MKAQYCFSCMNELAGQVANCPYCHASLPYQIKDRNDLPAGMVLKKRYLVGRSLGRGGFGATYIARDLKKDKVLTIKEYFPESASERRPGSNYVVIRNGQEERFHSYQKEFKAEAQHLKMLRDVPGVVQYYDFFDAFGTSYLVMSYLDGQTLKDAQINQHHPFSIQEGADYILRTLQVLARVHGKGILHRDVSPDNIFLTNNGQVYLIDFGSSSLLSQATMTGTAKGVYTAPEQKLGEKQYPCTDLYAVGITFFTLLMNHKPKEAEGIQLEEMPEAFPQPIRDVYMKATQRDPSQRYQSADEMARALSQATGVPMPPPLSNRNKKLKQLLSAMLALVAVVVAAIVLAIPSAEEPPKPVKDSIVSAVNSATPVAIQTPVSTVAAALPADEWLCRRDGQLYHISSTGMAQIANGAFPAEEQMLQPVDLRSLKSCQQIYDLDSFEIIHAATSQSFELTGVTDSVMLWLLPGEYALRVTKGDQMLAENFIVPAQGPVSLSTASESRMAAWWDAQNAETAESLPTETPVPHAHQWQNNLVKEATCAARGSMVQECSICGERGETMTIPALGHDLIEATCTESAACKRCGTKDTAHQPPLGHDMQEATCTEPKICKRCGIAEGSALGHSWGGWHGKPAATCTTGGTEERICGNCGERDERSIAALGHAWAEANCTSPSTCTVCGATSGKAIGHSWGRWHAKTAATCTTGGTEERICGNCGERDERSTAALGHAWAEADCTSPSTCTVCGVTSGKAIGHSWGSWHAKTAATCTTGGTEERICGNCGERDERSTATLGHAWAEADCTSPSTCTVCGATSGKAIGHSWGDWHGNTSTCTSAGREERICGNCGKSDYRYTSAKGHSEGAKATCTTAQICTRCNATLKEALGHTWAEANCTSPSTCTVCGEKSGTAVGHAWGDWHAKTAATCTAGGTEEHICGNCGMRETREVGALGHAHGEWIVVESATCYTTEISRRICGRCGQQEWKYGTETKPHAYFNGSCLWCMMAEPGVGLPGLEQ